MGSDYRCPLRRELVTYPEPGRSIRRLHIQELEARRQAIWQGLGLAAAAIAPPGASQEVE